MKDVDGADDIMATHDRVCVQIRAAAINSKCTGACIRGGVRASLMIV